MKKIIQTAACRFCGQMTQLDGDCELTKPQAEEKATMMCQCPEAVEYQKEKQRKEKALKNVSTLFGEDAAPEKRIGEGIESSPAGSSRGDLFRGTCKSNAQPAGRR